MHKYALFLFVFALSPPSMARDYVRVVGSSAIYPFMTVIVERFFRDEHQPAPIVESTGTGGGIRAFCAGIGDNHPDIVVAARPMTAAEKGYCAKHDIPNPLEIEIGLDASVLVTFDEAFSITIPELQKALSQNIQRWSDINPIFPTDTIRVVGPPTTSGVFDTFYETALKPAHVNEAYVEVIGHEGVVIKKLELNRKSLGLLSYTFLSQLKEPLKPLKINGVAPTEETIVSGTYPLARKSYMYVKTERLSPVKSLLPFLKYILSDPVLGPNGYVKKFGFIPLSLEAHEKQQKRVMDLIKEPSS